MSSSGLHKRLIYVQHISEAPIWFTNRRQYNRITVILS